jgi:hypothetical protein
MIVRCPRDADAARWAHRLQPDGDDDAIAMKVSTVRGTRCKNHPGASMEADMVNHGINGDDDVDEIALMAGLFGDHRQQERWKPWKALAVAFGGGAAAIGAAVLLLTSIACLAAVH